MKEKCDLLAVIAPSIVQVNKFMSVPGAVRMDVVRRRTADLYTTLETSYPSYRIP